MDVDGDDEEGTKVVRMGVLLCTEQDVERELDITSSVAMDLALHSRS